MITDGKNRLQPESFVELFELIAQDSGSRLILLQLKTVSLFFSGIEEEITIELIDYTLRGKFGIRPFSCHFSIE